LSGSNTFISSPSIFSFRINNFSGVKRNIVSYSLYLNKLLRKAKIITHVQYNNRQTNKNYLVKIVSNTKYCHLVLGMAGSWSGFHRRSPPSQPWCPTDRNNQHPWTAQYGHIIWENTWKLKLTITCLANLTISYQKLGYFHDSLRCSCLLPDVFWSKYNSNTKRKTMTSPL